MYIALTPTILCIFLLLMLMPDLVHFTRILTHATPTAATEEAHTDRRSGVGRPLLLLATLLASACSQPTLPDLGTVPSFSLHERRGATVTADSLRGHVWIANFIFTRCPDVCPCSQRADEDAAGRRSGRRSGPPGVVHAWIRPTTPPRCCATTPAASGPSPAGGSSRGARRRHRGAAPRRLQRRVRRRRGRPNVPITHSDRFVLVDRQLRIRGYYHGSDADDVVRLRRDAAALRAEKPS